MDHGGAVAQGRVPADGGRRLGYADRLPRELGLVGLEIPGLEDSAIGPDPDPGLEDEDVARHEALRVQLHGRAFAEGPGLGLGQAPQGLDALLGPVLGEHLDRRHGQDDEEYRDGVAQLSPERVKDSDGDEHEDEGLGELLREDAPEGYAMQLDDAVLSALG